VRRRTVLIAAVGAAPILAMAVDPAYAGVPQVAVNDQATPKDGKPCDGCELFVAPNSCKSVSGEISPTGGRKLWVKKAA
jgi:hypothetical protein